MGSMRLTAYKREYSAVIYCVMNPGRMFYAGGSVEF